MADSANVSGIRAGTIHFTFIKGDTFAPPPVSFESQASDEDPIVPEDFSGSSLKMQVKNDRGRVMAEITDGDGITVNSNALTFLIDADVMEGWTPGIYHYDVQKTISGIVSTIIRGTITITDEITQ